MELRKQFLEIADIDPFQYITIASVCMAIYRAHYIYNTDDQDDGSDVGNWDDWNDECDWDDESNMSDVDDVGYCDDECDCDNESNWNDEVD